MDRALLNFLASPREREISLGEVKGVLRLLPAAKLLEIRRKLTEFSADEQEQAMLGDAMVVAESLYVDGQRVFESGEQLLNCCSVQQLQELTEAYVALDKGCGIGVDSPREELEALKKA